MGCEAGHGESALIDQLVELTSRLQARMAELCEARGVNSARFAVLRAIADVNDVGCSQSELASQLRLSESNVCSLVERLRSSGLLFRFRSKTDRRRSVLMLTEHGRQLAEAITLAQNAQAVDLLSVLNVGQQIQLQQLLRRLDEYLDSRAARSSEGVMSVGPAAMIQESTRRAS